MLYTKQKAFTLVELIVVVTILAILATIGFVSYSSYLTGVRDTNRIAQMTSLSDGLNLYSTTNDLPIPEDNIEILAGTDLIAYQGYAGANILEIINFEKGGVDPKDNTYFSYYLTRDRKYFQLMGFLEEGLDTTANLNGLNLPPQKRGIEGEFSLISTTHAVNYQDRIPTVTGKKLGILTDLDNTPVQELGVDLDLLNSGTVEYNMHISNDEVYLATGESIISTYSLKDESLLYLDPTLAGYYSFDDCTADDNSSSGNDGILNQSPNCVSAKKGKGFQFNGLNQYIRIPSVPEFEYTGGNFSYGFWINASSSDVDGGYVVSKPWNSSGAYNYTLKNDLTGWIAGDVSAGNTYSDNVEKDSWQHIFVTLNGITKEMKIILNGKDVHTDTFQNINSWNAVNQNHNLVLMSLFPYLDATERSTHAVEGIMDELYLYNRVLTEYEIGIIYRK